ncbi:EF-hand domain-containing protein [Novosphingobium guangzhouense]|uniref:Calcium-binding protein n=1 Tax=Novosphingobium guangzhouense TaxID=1850347 RepID=A0A2K2G665_9SPHN|nr:EF-hand domain-containing protein [Novosphingobium guangzhouense]PNU06519.1 calcium-binding protein [Novosphingobium guangzhouense]
MRPARTITPLLAALLITLAPPALAQGMPGGMDGGMGGGGMGGGDMGGGGGPPGGGGGAGRPPQPPKPIKRARFDKIVTDMFRDADTNHDGTVTLDELHALVEARRAAIIKERFITIDTDRNGSISMAEFTAWQGKMGSAASSEDAATGERNGPIAEAVMPDAGDDRQLAALIEPLSGTVIARANTNYDAGISLEELLAYEGKLFDAADTDHDGYLSMEELRPRDKDGQRMRRPGGPMGAPAGGPPPCPPGQSC